LIALDMYLGPTAEIVLIGEPKHADTAAVLRELHQKFLPNKVVAARPPAGAAYRSPLLDPVFDGKAPSPTGEPTLFVCENFACQAPVVGRDAIVRKIGEI